MGDAHIEVCALVIGFKPGARFYLGDVAGRVGASRWTCRRVLSALEVLGYVERVPAEEDGPPARVLRWVRTDKGNHYI